MLYTPDRWVVVNIETPTETIPKVFAGWYGGFAQGESWKLSSGIVKIVEYTDRFEFTNFSGSVYICYKNRQGMSGYMSSLYEHWVNNTEYKLTLQND